MRNVLVFPDDDMKQSFKYPEDEVIDVGYAFTVTMKDDSTHILLVDEIKTIPEDHTIYYYLKL